VREDGDAIKLLLSAIQLMKRADDANNDAMTRWPEITSWLPGYLLNPFYYDGKIHW
jgi:hypothetical protein